MKLDVLDEWVTALDSGEYPQTKGALKDADGYCCLGVLCEIAVKHGVIPPVKHSVHPTGESYEYDDDIVYLPARVQEWAGLKFHDPYAAGLRLSTYNDEDNLSFPEIAHLIRTHLKDSDGTEDAEASEQPQEEGTA